MRAILSFLLVSLISLQLQAQQATLFGKVTEMVDGKPVPVEAASVTVEGTARSGGYTDVDGNFVVNVPPGTYTLIVRMVEYKEFRQEGIILESGARKQNDATLELNSVSTGPIVINGTPNKTGNGTVLGIRREGPGMNSGVSGSDISRSPDRNTGQVLRRVSGASIQENRFVIIRGLSDRYNTAQLNGMALPSTEPDRKAFAFDIFPAAMLDNLIIQKTATPDLPGAFAGGVIQLNTKDIPEKTFLNLSYSGNFNTQSTFREYLTYRGGKLDWMGRDDGSRGLPTSIPGSDDFKQLLTNVETRYTASSLFANDWQVLTKPSMMPGLNGQVSFGTFKQMGRHTIGIIAAGLHQYNQRLTLAERGDYNFDSTRIYAFADRIYGENVNMGGLLNLTWSLDSGDHKISFKALANQTGEDLMVDRNGFDFGAQQFIRATSMQYTGTRLINYQLAGVHQLTRGGVQLRWDIGYTKLNRDVPDLRRMYYNHNVGDSVFQAFVPVGAPSPNYAGKFYGFMTETMWGGDAHLSLPFKIKGANQKFNMGYSQQLRDRSFDARVFGYVISNPMTFDWTRLSEGQDTIFEADAIGDDGFRLMESTNNNDSYTAGSSLHAAYAMFDNRILRKVRLVWGLRTEIYNQHLNAVSYGGDTIGLDTTFTDILPSVNFNYEVKEDMFVRLAASRTVSRPEFRELAPFSFYDFNTSASVYGNDSLQRGYILNFDARWEVYPKAGQFLAVTGFYKSFQNPIEQVIDGSSGGGSRVYTYQNVVGANNLGIELEMRIKANRLDSLIPCKLWDRITWFTNLSFISSRVDLSNVPNASPRPLQGQSPYLFNTGLQYWDVTRGFTVNLLFNRSGRRIFQVGNNGYLDVYEAPRSVLDFQVALRVLKKAEIKANFSDVLNQKNVFYQDQNANGKFDDGVDTQFFGLRYGANMSLGFGLNF